MWKMVYNITRFEKIGWFIFQLKMQKEHKLISNAPFTRLHALCIVHMG